VTEIAIEILIVTGERDAQLHHHVARQSEISEILATSGISHHVI
jgi:hypothetical protein